MPGPVLDRGPDSARGSILFEAGPSTVGVARVARKDSRGARSAASGYTLDLRPAARGRDEDLTHERDRTAPDPPVTNGVSAHATRVARGLQIRVFVILTLSSWGLRPFLEYQLDLRDWSWTSRPLPEAPRTYDGYAGFAQELVVQGRGTVLLAVFVRDGDLVLLVGNEAFSLFGPGLKLEHRRGKLFSTFRVTTPDGKTSDYVYRRPDLLLAIIDSTYDDLDLESVHLAAALPSIAARSREELVAEWSARAAAPKPAMDGERELERSGADEKSERARRGSPSPHVARYGPISRSAPSSALQTRFRRRSR